MTGKQKMLILYLVLWFSFCAALGVLLGSLTAPWYVLIAALFVVFYIGGKLGGYVEKHWH